MAINTIIATNIIAMTAHRNLGSIGNSQNRANKRLSSGKKINSASDDVAGLSISEKMKAQIRGLNMATKNSQDTISLIQTAEGSLTEVSNMLTRIRELTVQAGNDTNQQSDRVKIAEEVASLLTEIDSISTRTEFNNKKLNNGSIHNAFFQIGSNENQKLNLSIGDMSVGFMEIDDVIDVFGISKRIDTSLSSSQTGVIISDGAKHNALSQEFQSNENNDIGKAVFQLEFKDNITDEREHLSITLNFNPPIAKGEMTVDILAEELNKNKQFSEMFIASSETVGQDVKLDISNKYIGGETNITGLGVDFYDTEGEQDPKSGIFYSEVDPQAGHYGKIDISGLNQFETITLGNQVYTKVPKEDVYKVHNGFSTAEELKDLLNQGEVYSKVLEEDGREIVQIDYIKHQESNFAGVYKVREKEVSDKGEEFSNALKQLDNAISHISKTRAKLGANQNRLEHTMKNLGISSENLSASRLRIEDADMAKEMMNLTKSNVLGQAATSILAQANQLPNNIIQLLG